MQIALSSLSITPNPSQNMTELVIEFLTLVGIYQNDWLNAGISTVLMPNLDRYEITFLWSTPEVPTSVLFPFFDKMRLLSTNYTVVSNATTVPMFESYSEAQQKYIGPLSDAITPFGISFQISTRLIPQSFFASASSARQVAEAVWAGVNKINNVADVGEPGTFGSSPPFISGSLPGKNRAKVNETGANPALYNAAWHVTFGAWWSVTSRDTFHDLISAIQQAVDPLTELGIVGSYQAQAGAYEPNWQETFFGYKYSNLTAIKRKYDPNNFFNSWMGVDFVDNHPAYQCYGPNGPTGSSVIDSR